VVWLPNTFLGEKVNNEIKQLKKELNEFRYLYGSVISRINKLEDDTRAAIEFADLAEDDRGTEMILKFCDDITELVGE
jgi:archaellum component FlaC